jgi:glycosyltransferase involved in cell wall biosynthesis
MRKYTVVVGVPAYNEEQNIAYLLESVLSQRCRHLDIKKIYVLDDGSDDGTCGIVRKFGLRDGRVELVEGGSRKGKTRRLNQLYRLSDGDFLVTLDADVVMADSGVLERLVLPLIEDERICFVVAHHVPIKPDGFVGRVIYSSYGLWDNIRLSVGNYDHIHNCFGAASALRKSFYKGVRFPRVVSSDRGYLYILASKQCGFRYARDAVVYYRPVSTVEDLRSMTVRSLSKNEEVLASVFGDWVFDTYAIPLRIKIKGILLSFWKDPLYVPLAILLNVVWRFLPRRDELYEKGMWKITTSTKKAIREVPNG